MNSAFFTANRARLLEALGGQAVVVATAYREMQRSNDASFLFAQEANFRYLTGITAPDWRLIIDGYHDRSYAVMPEVDAIKQVFDGSLSAEQAQQVSGVDEVIDSEQASALLRRLAKTTKTVHIVDQSSRLASAGFVLNPAHSELREQMGRYFRETKNCFVELARLRAIKQPVEIAALQRAIDITVDGFRILRAELDTYRHEYEAEARLHYEFRRVGAQGHAYDPIVGDGEHACTLHYVANDATLVRRSLLLIDAGAQWQGYAADITRTYSVGQPTRRMRAVHAAVHGVQQAVIALCRPGTPLIELQETAERETAKALATLGLAHDDDAVRRYFPHAIGHGLGLDVHDSLGGYDTLQPGMVLTVEPGLYIRDEKIGVRIEDDILITPDGHRNLSGQLSTDL